MRRSSFYIVISIGYTHLTQWESVPYKLFFNFLNKKQENTPQEVGSGPVTKSDIESSNVIKAKDNEAVKNLEILRKKLDNPTYISDIIKNKTFNDEEETKTQENKKDIFNHKGENITSRIEETNFSQQAEIKFSLSKQAQDYFDIHQTDSSEEKRNRGIALHNICSKIYEEKDLETLSLSQEDKAVIKQMFTEAKNYKWFDGTYKVLNEKEIISNGEVKRIDRIMFGKDEVIILDYKFTEDTENEEKYHKQLKEYKQIVSQMGYKNIKTYLWFVGIKIEEVK